MFGCCGFGKDDPRDENEAEKYERKILELAGLKYKKDFLIYNEQLPEFDGWIHTIEAGMENKQQLVLVHGYGATGVFYYKMIKDLRHYFHVYAVDLFGFGQSARPSFNFYTFQDSINFFLDPFEKWRRRRGVNDFVLVAHSLGGYLMTQYMRVWKPSVKMLYLISPAGFTIKTKEEITARMGQYVSGMKMVALNFSFYLMEDLQVSPFSLLFAKREQAIDSFFRHKRMGMSEQEITLFKKYYLSIIELPACGEKALGSFLFYGCYSKRPLSDVLKKMRDDMCNVRIFYGDADWMDFEHAIEVNRDPKINYDIQIVPNSGHQILIQNPSYLNSIIIEDLQSNYDPYKYFKELYERQSRQSYINESKAVLQFLTQTATDLTMLND